MIASTRLDKTLRQQGVTLALRNPKYGQRSLGLIPESSGLPSSSTGTIDECSGYFSTEEMIPERNNDTLRIVNLIIPNEDGQCETQIAMPQPFESNPNNLSNDDVSDVETIMDDNIENSHDTQSSQVIKATGYYISDSDDCDSMTSDLTEN